MARSKNTALRFQNIATRRATSLQTHPRQPLMGRGRGNLRENRKDPAPTVGICGDIIAIQMLSHCRRYAHTVHPACPSPKETLWFLQQRGTPRRYGLREMELVIETSLPVRRISYKRLSPPPGLSPRSLLEYGGLNPILPVLGERSDAACRVVILPFAVPVDAHVGANDGRCGRPHNVHPANARL